MKKNEIKKPSLSQTLAKATPDEIADLLIDLDPVRAAEVAARITHGLGLRLGQGIESNLEVEPVDVARNFFLGGLQQVMQSRGRKKG